MRKILLIILSFAVISLIVAGYFLLANPPRSLNRSRMVIQYIRNPLAHQDWAVNALTRCGEAPFLFPTRGFIGYFWDDSFKVGHRHQGIDVFGGMDPGVTAVYAAYEGYLTRQVDWKSSVIIRIPSDPLQPGRQIWTYYTHMADADGNSTIDTSFPPGTSEVFVKAGTLLGYQGNYSGTAGKPAGVHLHFSIVKDDGRGSFLNELDITNTLDPTSYLGLELNAKTDAAVPVKCQK